jgi:hypothetical protein
LPGIITEVKILWFGAMFREVLCDKSLPSQCSLPVYGYGSRSIPYP